MDTAMDFTMDTAMDFTMDSAQDSELKDSVHSHAVFFDQLVEMIPANIYVSKENPTDQWVHGMSKKARAESKRRTKLNLKKAKRARLDPENARTTLEVINQQEKTSDTPSERAVVAGGEADKPRTVTYEELRERLHKRIEMLRAKRHADLAASTAKVAKEWQNQKKSDSLKRNRKNKAVDPEAADGETGLPTAKRPKLETKQPASDFSEEELEFSRVKMGIGASPGQYKKKPSKEKLLAQATILQKEMEDPEKGQEVSSKHAWSAAVSRAAGEKVLDNPKLLKKSIKRDEGLQKRSAKKWQERIEMEKKGQQVKQQNRKEHIQQRSTEKKERSIAKREKKLARPGFEGRKQGFINKGD